jgi:hypothetical protein
MCASSPSIVYLPRLEFSTQGYSQYS